jgi:hypothetical protein
MNYTEVEHDYIGQGGVHKTITVPRDFKVYLKNLEKDAFDAFKLYDLISLALYQDEHAWSTLPDGIFHQEILRHFFNDESLEKLKGESNEQ